MFFGGLLLFCIEVVKSRPACLSVMLYFFAVASASLSLSAKTQGFSMLIVMILVLLPQVRRGSVATAGSHPQDPHPQANQRAGRPRLQVA
jgi:hypothetical protein